MNDAITDADQPRHPGPRPSGTSRPDARFEALLESAPDAIVIVDERGRIQIVNSEAELMFGYPRSELIGQPVELLVPNRHKQVHAENRGRYTAKPKTRPMGVGLNLSARRKNGSEFPVEISLSPMPTDGGLLITSVIRDVSSRRRLEDAALSVRAIEAQEQERLRIARDLHDEVAQALSGIALGLEEVESATDLEAAREQAKRLGQELARTMGELRRVVEHLHPDEVADLGLASSLERMANDRQRSNPNIKISFHSDGNDRRLDPEVELAVYRVVQEALTNAIKHADAKTIEIELAVSDSSTTARIRDDGGGFDVEAGGMDGLGLGGMRERARLLRGELEIDSAPGRGTVVALRLPVESA